MELRIPVIKNREYELNIDSLGINGEGIGRIDGFALFIERALPGERVRVKVLKVCKNYAYAKLLEVLSPSPARAVPPCPYFGRCGGCDLQHLSYPEQLEFKTKTVRDALIRIGGLRSPNVLQTIGMDNPWRYRNKGQFPVAGEKGSEAVGLYASSSHRIIDIDSCLIQHEVSDSIIAVFKDFMKRYGVSAYDEVSQRGIIRHIVSKIAFSNGEVMVIAVTNTDKLPFNDELVAMLRKQIPGLKSVVQNVNTESTNVVLGSRNKVLWGESFITDMIDNLSFRISPLSFFQVNPVQTKILYDKALQYAELDGTQTVLDLFCGIGTISLFLARRAKFVYGVEEVSHAVKDAEVNAKLNGISNVRFICGDAKVVFDKIPSDTKIDVVVVDPPRKGCEPELLDGILKLSPARVVYVSCNPATLARDVKHLAQGGYELIEAQPVDMFAHTGHVESVVLMSRVDK
jgi:23S rRNA (uracil1939-C5)-methyltransferase